MPAGDTPCSRTECRYHLAYRQPGEHRLEPTRDCALAVANEGSHTLEEVAAIRTWPRDGLLELAPAYWQKTLEQPETQDKLAANFFRRAVLSPPS